MLDSKLFTLLPTTLPDSRDICIECLALEALLSGELFPGLCRQFDDLLFPWQLLLSSPGSGSERRPVVDHVGA